jgi:L-asparaginase
MKKIAVLSLGGTIAMRPNTPGGGVTPALNAADLIAAVPGLADVAELEAIPFCNIPSAQLTFGTLGGVVDMVTSLEQRGFDGVVITQGTDTIEESAWVLDLCCQTSMAVVVTGAMRHSGQPGADGPSNVLASVQVAASPAAKGRGVLVVFNDQIHAARFVQKAHTSSVGAFVSPNCGPMGWVSEGDVILPKQIPPVMGFANLLDRELPIIPILKPGLSEGPEIIGAISAANIGGLVLEGAGGGHTTPAITEILGELAKRVPVIFSSRTRAGAVLTKTYGYAGAEFDLLARGLIPAGDLDALKARIVLMLSVMSSSNLEEATSAFKAVAYQLNAAGSPS